MNKDDAFDLSKNIQIKKRYVAFCDVLGFSNAVETRFEETIAVYTDFMGLMKDWPFPEKAEVSVYSDSILIVADDLQPVIHAVNNLLFATLTHNWLLRGGIAYGNYWENKENGNLFVVSDALVKAVRLETTVSYPAVAFSPEIDLPISAWIPRFEHGLIDAPVLHFRGLSIVNPFNRYWFASAHMRVSQMLDEFPQHEKKYRWFMELWEAVNRNDELVPEAILAELIRLKILAPLENQ